MATHYLVLDFESVYSREYSLRRMTPVEYLLSPLFDCLGCAVIEGISPNLNAVWYDPVPFQTLLNRYRQLQLQGDKIVVVSHNSLFDVCLLRWRFGFLPDLSVDTMGMARALIQAFTRGVSLKLVAKHLGLAEKGDTILKVEGMNAEAIKQAGLWEDYTRYACNDAEICRDIFLKLRPDFPVQEYAIMDMVIRMAVSPRFKLNAGKLAQYHHEVVVAKEGLLQRVGLYDRDQLMSDEMFAMLLRSYGVEPQTKTSPRTGKQTFAFAKTDQFMADLEEHENPDVQALVAARLGFKSTIEETRSKRMLDISMLTWPGNLGTGWFPNPLRYAGAHTHRLSGDWKLNTQNWARGGTIRDAVEAPPGYTVVTCDASQIEARFTPWLCGQDDLVEAFRQGRDIYSEFAAEEIYRREVNKKEHPKERFVGKQVILGCFAADTQVLTSNGWKPIINITKSDLLWDGAEWVKHDGVIYQGFKETETAYGLTATPDHEILTERGWLEWNKVHTNPSRFLSALDTVGSPSSASSGIASAPGNQLAGILSAGATVGGKAVSTGTVSVLGAAPSATHAQKSAATPSATGNTTAPWLMTRIAHVFSTVFRRASAAATTLAQRLTSTMGRAAFVSSMSGAPTVPPSYGMFKPSKVGTTPSSKWTGSTSTGITSPATSGSLPGQVTSKTSAASPTSSSASVSSKQRSHVFDVVNAGPRHRFMVMTSAGPIIVHNCGFGVGGPKFQNMIKTLSRLQLGEVMDMSVDEATTIVQAYRRRYSKIPDGWDYFKQMFPQLAREDSKIEWGPITFRHQYIEGPTGLRLFYHNLRYDTVDGRGAWLCDYAGRRKFLHGGKMMENVIQHLARCFIFEVALAVKKAYPQWGLMAHQVHDELVYVVPNAIVPEFKAYLLHCMQQAPAWAPGLPVTGEAGEGPSYGEAK